MNCTHFEPNSKAQVAVCDCGAMYDRRTGWRESEDVRSMDKLAEIMDGYTATLRNLPGDARDQVEQAYARAKALFTAFIAAEREAASIAGERRGRREGIGSLIMANHRHDLNIDETGTCSFCKIIEHEFAALTQPNTSTGGGGEAK